MSSCPYSFTHASVAEDGTLYLTGVVLELEDRDVLHTILWERVDGQWNRYQWNNRTYDVAAYPHAGKTAAAYLGFEGTLKVRSRVAGSSVQRLETGDDAPSSLRTVGCIRRIGQSLFVVGMRRMAFRRRLEETDWTRFDGGMRQERRALEIAGLYSIDGSSEDLLIACGMNGEIWLWSSGRWTREGSPTDAWLGAARHVGEAEFVLAGAQGSVVVGTPGRWRTVPHDFKDETFSSIEVAAGRCLLAADSGRVFELTRGEHPSLTAFPVEGLTSVSSIVTAADGTYFVGRTEVRSLGPEGWRDDSPPPALMTGPSS